MLLENIILLILLSLLAQKQKISSTQTQEKEILGANKQELGDLYRALVALNIASAKEKELFLRMSLLAM